MTLIWKKLELNDRWILETAIKKDQPETSDLNFTNLWMWSAMRNTHFAFIKSFLCIRINDHGTEKFLMPIGQGDEGALMTILLSEAQQRNKPLIIRAIKEDRIETFKQVFPTPYLCEKEEEHADYIYSHDALSLLKGNKYQAKRNLIHQFDRQYDHEYGEIDAKLLPLVIQMQREWFEERGDRRISHLYDEHVAIMRVLHNFYSLNIRGGALLAKGKVVAYSIAEPISPTMLLVHIEKALHPYKGAYQAINQSFMQHFPPTILYINREEDLGLPQLIQAKRSYYPVRMIHKFCIIHDTQRLAHKSSFNQD